MAVGAGAGPRPRRSCTAAAWRRGRQAEGAGLDEHGPADAGQVPLDGAQGGAGGEGEVVELGVLVDLLEAVDERAALDGRAAAQRVDPAVRADDPGREVQVEGEGVARLPLSADRA
ncbi:hypothetical protein GCM10020220_050690 [Nonomuraea rubra]